MSLFFWRTSTLVPFSSRFYWASVLRPVAGREECSPDQHRKCFLQDDRRQLEEISVCEGIIADVAIDSSPPSSSIPTASSSAPETTKVEIKDAELIFEAVWKKLEAKFPKSLMRFPKEIIWLMGAPGSGKGTNTPFIQRVRGIPATPLIMSSLLTSPEMQEMKKKGQLIGDVEVLEMLLTNLLRPEYYNGVIVDGFPRTNIQVDCIKKLRDKMQELRSEYAGTAISHLFQRPIFRVAVLFVDEIESVRRQLFRGKQVQLHNQQVRQSGIGTLLEERSTDTDEEYARQRYAIFRDHYSTIQSLREHFTFSLINANGSIHQVEEAILSEFRYQSSVELAEDTYDAISRVPLAEALTQNARQELVSRLDSYRVEHEALLERVIDLLQSDFVPSIRRHYIAGTAIVRSDNSVFEDPLAIEMVIDVLSERGYFVNCDVSMSRDKEGAAKYHLTFILLGTIEKAVRVNLKTGQIEYDTKKHYYFTVRFKRYSIRGGWE